MKRDTNNEVHRRIVNEGLLTGAQTLIYDALFKHGPCTAAELGERGKVKGGWKRLSELKRRGCVAEVGFKTCTTTGSHALIWDVTSNLPEPLPVVETAKDRIRSLERENRRLDRKLSIYRDLIRKLHRTTEDSRLILETRLQLESEKLGE